MRLREPLEPGPLLLGEAARQYFGLFKRLIQRGDLLVRAIHPRK